MSTENTGYIRRCWAAFGSMQLFFSLALLIAFWFFISLVIYPSYFKVFNALEETTIIQWLLETGDGACPVRGWLIVLIILVALMTVNLAVCVVDDFNLIKKIRSKKNNCNGSVTGRVSILIIHLSYIILILGHLASAMLGTKYSFDLKEGELIKDATLPFTMQCTQIASVMDEHNSPVPVATIIINPGDAGEKEIKLCKSETIFTSGRLMVMGSRDLKLAGDQADEHQGRGGGRGRGAGNRLEPKQEPVTVPVARVIENPGLPIDIAGGILFFGGMVLRMMFRRKNGVKPQ